MIALFKISSLLNTVITEKKSDCHNKILNVFVLESEFFCDSQSFSVTTVLNKVYLKNKSLNCFIKKIS